MAVDKKSNQQVVTKMKILGNGRSRFGFFETVSCALIVIFLLVLAVVTSRIELIPDIWVIG